MPDNLYQVGDVVPLQATFKDANGTPTDTTVALEIRAPDGTVTTPTPTHGTAGVYTYNLTVNQAGLWWYSFVGTGAVAATEQGSLVVEQRESATPTLGTRALVTLEETREYVLGSRLDDSNDVKLMRRINAFSEAAFNYTKREWLPQTNGLARTFVYPGYGMVSLSPFDLRTVTSVVAFTDYPSSYQLTLVPGDAMGILGDYRLRQGAGALTGTYRWIEFGKHPYTNLPLWPFDLASGYRDFNGRFQVTITGSWGIATTQAGIPADVKLAILIAVDNSYKNPEGAATRQIGPLGFTEPTEPFPEAFGWRALPAESRALLSEFREEPVVVA